MAFTINVKSIDELSEAAREFVTEKDGVFTYDDEKAFNALKNERAEHRADKQAFAPFKALNISAEELAKYVNLGKNPAELAEIIAKASKPAEKPNVTQTTEYLELKKQVDTLNKMKDRYEAAEAENLKNKRNDLVRAEVRKLPDEIDKELFGSFVEQIMDKFNLNTEKNGLSPIGEKLPSDFLADMAKQYRFVKSSTPGKASPGNATLPSNGKNADFEAAKANRDPLGMLNAYPDK